MFRKEVLVTITLAVMVFLFVGCDNSSDQGKNSNVSVVTNNEMNVNLLTSNMVNFPGLEADSNTMDSLSAKVSNGVVDFTSLTYSEGTVNVGEVVYVEGVIPQNDYPSDKVIIAADPESKVEFENAVLTNKDENTILTMDVVGKEAGSAKVYVGLDDAESYYTFDLNITEESTRTMPNSYSVYCTPTGGKYHAYGCSYLRGNGIAISINDALAKGLGPCSRCRP